MELTWKKSGAVANLGGETQNNLRTGRVMEWPLSGCLLGSVQNAQIFFVSFPSRLLSLSVPSPWFPFRTLPRTRVDGDER